MPIASRWNGTSRGSMARRPISRPRHSSFRGFYTILFREHSGLVHATMRGLNRVTVDLAPPRKRVVLEAPLGESRGPYGMATVVYGVGLLVAAQALGWPDAEKVNAVFARFP
jgi:hypothetical protein